MIRMQCSVCIIVEVTPKEGLESPGDKREGQEEKMTRSLFNTLP